MTLSPSQPIKVSMLFDIKDREVNFPIAGALPIAPFFMDKSVQLCILFQSLTSSLMEDSGLVFVFP